MKKFKSIISVILMLSILLLSIVSTNAIVISEDAIIGDLQWQDKVDELLVEKMSNSSKDDLIPVWVWLTDIDVEALENEIEAKTGVSQEELDMSRSEIDYDISSIDLQNTSNMSINNNSEVNIDDTIFDYLEETESQREKIAEDTEVYLSTKKKLARQQYVTNNSNKLTLLNVSSERIIFTSELSPTFIAFFTKDEIIEMAKSDCVEEIGYFTGYDDVQELEFDIEQQQGQTEIASTSYNPYDGPIDHVGLKQAIQFDVSFEKYGMTGDGIDILHLDGDFVRTNQINAALLHNTDNIKHVVNQQVYPVENQSVLPPFHSTHANHCLAYLQSFAEDANIYCIAKYSVTHDDGINAYEDVEYTINNYSIDLISCSANEDINPYDSSFSAKWFDAITSMYGIPLIASAGNDIPTYPQAIDPSSGYNSISVGVYKHNNSRMFDDYTYNNLDSKTRSWYKPDVVVAMDYIPATTIGYIQYGGTSAGAPVVSGIAATMMQLDPSLIGQPEVIKAILMASCHEKALRSNKDENQGVGQETMESGLTLKQGAGKINALRALNIVAFRTFGSGYITSNRNWINASKFYLNSNVYSNGTINYPVNVSVAWFRYNSKSSNIPSEDQVELGDYYDINLSVFHTDQTEEEKKKSEVENAGKQLVFIGNPELDKEYTIRLSWPSDNSSERGMVKYGYAYSVGNFEKVLEKAELVGTTAIGKTLTADTYTADSMPAETSALEYRWLRSSDGNTWQVINGAVSPEYTLTDSDFNKYIKCRVTQNYLKDYIMEVETDVLSVRFGDADMDGDVTTIDATYIEFYIEGTIEFTKEELLAADVNNDGYVTDLDAILIRQYCARIIDHFPVEE